MTYTMIICILLGISITYDIVMPMWLAFIRQYQTDRNILKRGGKPAVKLIRYVRKHLKNISKDKISIVIEQTEDSNYYSYDFIYNIDDNSRIEIKKEWISFEEIFTNFNVCPSKLTLIQVIDGTEYKCGISILALNNTKKLSNIIMSVLIDTIEGKKELDKITLISNHIVK